MSEINRADVELKVAELRAYVEKGYGDADARVRWAREALQEAMEADIDVSDLEAQMPELERGAIRKKAVRKVFDLRECVQTGEGNADARVRWTREAIQEAAAAGNNVSDLEAQMLELEQEVERKVSM